MNPTAPPPSPVHPVVWGRMFLRKHLTADSPPFHHVLADVVFGPARRVCLAAPRGHAKSTIASLVCLLYGAAHGLFRYCLLVSDSSDQAELFLREIRQECETNEALLGAYPGLAPARPWSEGDLCFQNGVRIQAVGQGKKIRGRKHRGSRPDLIVCDDLENDDLVSSLERRTKLRKWFRAALLPALSPGGRVRVVGTILHSDSLLARLLRTAGWERRKWRALNDGGAALWPSWKPAAELLREKAEAQADGLLASWYQEYQNEPIAAEEAAFRPTDFQYFQSLPLDQWGRALPVEKTLYVDPAISQSERADFSAYTVVLATHDGRWYVREAFRARHNPDQILETIVALQKKYEFDRIGVESIQFQKALVHWLGDIERETGLRLPVEEIHPDQDKRRRILALQPYFRAGRVFLWEGLDGRLESELLNLDSTDHDDLADSLAGHLFIARRPVAPKAPKPEFKDRGEERAHKFRKLLLRQAKERGSR